MDTPEDPALTALRAELEAQRAATHAAARRNIGRLPADRPGSSR